MEILGMSSTTLTKLQYKDMMQTIDIKARRALPPVGSFIKSAAKIYGVTVAGIKSKSREKRVTQARRWASYNIMKSRNNASEVGRALNKDHSSVLFQIYVHAKNHNLPLLRPYKYKYEIQYLGSEPTLKEEG